MIVGNGGGGPVLIFASLCTMPCDEPATGVEPKVVANIDAIGRGTGSFSMVVKEGVGLGS